MQRGSSSASNSSNSSENFVFSVDEKTYSGQHSGRGSDGGTFSLVHWVTLLNCMSATHCEDIAHLLERFTLHDRTEALWLDASGEMRDAM